MIFLASFIISLSDFIHFALYLAEQEVFIGEHPVDFLGFELLKFLIRLIDALGDVINLSLIDKDGVIAPLQRHLEIPFLLEELFHFREET